MQVVLNSKLKEYIDVKAKELMQLLTIEKTDIAEKKDATPPPEYFRHKKVIHLGEVLGPVDFSQSGFDSKLLFKMRNFPDEKVGYKDEDFKEIHKLTDSILKDKTINNVVSHNFIVNKIFEWLIGTHRNKIDEPKLSHFIQSNLEESVIEHVLFFPVLFLESNRELNIVNVNFKYISDELINEFAIPVPHDRKDEFVKVLEKYKGYFMANCKVVAEKEKAISIAIDNVSFAIDILKIASPTIDYPQIPIYFDADFRNSYQLKNEVLVRTYKTSLTIDFYRKAHPFDITEKVWEYLSNKNLELLNSYSLTTLEKKTELDSLIHNAIRRFAKAISNIDLHERITQIFSVLESLLLPSESSAILDSVCKYLPKILTKNIDERARIILITKELYKVRSSMIHHGQQKEFEMGDLASIQRCTLFLLQKLIQLSSKHKTKHEVLNEIDELIHRA